MRHYDRLVTAEAASRPPFPRSVLVLVAIGAVGLLLWLLRGALTPVLVAFLIAYMLDPVVDRLERWKLPRALAIVALLALSLALFALVLLLVVPGVVRELGQFAADLPRQAGRLFHRIEPWLADRGVSLPHSMREALSQFGGDAKELASKAAAPAGQVLGYLVGGTASLLGAVLGLLVIPVFSFYLLYDFDRITSGMHGLVPPRLRPFVLDMANEVDEVLGQFVRGQLLIMLLLAVLYSLAYSLIGVRLAVPIGIVAGLLSFIPYVGGATALGLALLMCLMAGTSWAQVGGVVAAYAVIQALEGFVITPRIMQEKVGLSAVWVLLALLVFGELFGFFGVLIAVPAAAVAKIFVLRALEHYRKSPLFTGASGSGAEPQVAVAGVGTSPVLGALLAEEGLPDDAALARDKRSAAEPRARVRRNAKSSQGDSPRPEHKVERGTSPSADEAPKSNPQPPSAAPVKTATEPAQTAPTPAMSASEPPKAGGRRTVKTRSTGNA